MTTCAQLVEAARRKRGNRKTSDRQLGELLGGISQQDISKAKYGYMSDAVAMAIADALGMHRAEVIIFARAEREKTPAVRAALLDYAGKALRLVLQKAVGALAALGVALGALSSPERARAAWQVGGESAFRKRRSC